VGSYKHRLAARTDANQAAIVKELESVPGITVESGHDDILVGYKKNTYWFELKQPGCVSRKTGKLLESCKQDSQKRLEREWTGHYAIVCSINQIYTDLGLLNLVNRDDF